NREPRTGRPASCLPCGSRRDRSRGTAVAGSFARVRIAAWTICLTCWTVAAGAAPPEPTSPHPRMLLDANLRAAWKAQRKDGAVGRAVELCEDADNAREHGGALYMGSEWKKMLQACLVAWAATGDARHAGAALRYFTALLDDLDALGNGKG